VTLKTDGAKALLAAAACRQRLVLAPPQKRFPQKNRGQPRSVAPADVPSFAPAVGVTQTKEATMKTETTTAKIAALNDLCRTAMGIAGRLVQTAGICALPQEDQSAIRQKVETFDAFTPDNDPHKERDFGAFEHNGERVFWKIDYYDRNMEYHSEDASDPKQTIRVLTIMLASEY
jgi:hypothetical protein